MSYKLLFAITAVNNFEIEQMDIKTAFLYGDIDTEIYIEQPEGIKAIRELYKVYKLNKVFYSLK
jgi:Reverse transcriptase (RNA-dependent DNA polymerase)